MTDMSAGDYNTIRSDHNINEPFSSGGRAPGRMMFDFGLMLSLFSGTSRDGQILDFGCGSAWLSELLVRQGFRTMSFDIHDDLERIIRLRKAADIRLDAKNWEFIQGDAHDMPFANSCFSQVCCYDSLHHMHDYLKVFKEFYRVTKKGGRIIFVEPGARHSTSPETIAFLESLGDKQPGWIERDVILEEIDSVVRQAGFDSGIQIIPNMHPLALQEFDLLNWNKFINGDKKLRKQLSDYLSRVNYWEKTIFYVEK